MRRADGAPQRIDHDQQFHQIVVGGKAGRLDDEHVLAADIFLDLDEDLHVGEAAHHRLGEGQLQILADGFGERAVGIARDAGACPAIRSDPSSRAPTARAR